MQGSTFQNVLDNLRTQTNDELDGLKVAIDEILTERTADKDVGKFYDEIRDSLKARYSPNQIDSLSPWSALRAARRQRFKKAWVHAMGELLKLGINHTFRSLSLTIQIVSESPYFHQDLRFDDVIISLEKFDVLFERAFTGYKDSEFLREVLNAV